MRRSTATAWTIVWLLLLLPVWSAPQAPYPPSTVLTNITWDHAGAAIHQAQGSDLWPFAWAGNDNLYTAWGDGGGANGDNTKCRTTFGVHGVSGSPPNFTFSNIWGCKADGTGCDTHPGPRMTLSVMRHSARRCNRSGCRTGSWPSATRGRTPSIPLSPSRVGLLPILG